MAFCSACREVEVAGNITQNQALQIVTELNARGINSEIMKSVSGKGVYAVMVQDSERLVAITTITKLGLLPDQDSDFNELTKSRGFMPNSKDIESLRLDRAMAVELEDVMMAHPEISAARVVLRLHNLTKEQSPAASIVLSCDDCEKLDQGKVTKMINNVVPGVASENIMLIISGVGAAPTDTEVTGLDRIGDNITPVTLVPFLIWKVPAGADFELGISALIVLFLALLLGLVIGLGVVNWKRKNSDGIVQLPESGNAVLGIERPASEIDVKDVGNE